MTLLLSLFGPSGSGKTTAADHVAQVAKFRGWVVHREDVARPLHEVQHEYRFAVFGSMWREDEEAMGQDRELFDFVWGRHAVEVLGMFEHRVQIHCGLAERPERMTAPTLVLNGDARDNAYEVLSALGFEFIEVLSDPEKRRARLIARDGSYSEDPKDQFTLLRRDAEEKILNFGSEDEFIVNVETVVLPLLEAEERRFQVKREDIRPRPREEWVRLFPDRPPVGCLDGLCLWGSPRGQHTNGGCRCIQHDGMVSSRQELSRALELVRALVREREDISDAEDGSLIWIASDD